MRRSDAGPAAGADGYGDRYGGRRRHRSARRKRRARRRYRRWCGPRRRAADQCLARKSGAVIPAGISGRSTIALAFSSWGSSAILCTWPYCSILPARNTRPVRIAGKSHRISIAHVSIHSGASRGARYRSKDRSQLGVAGYNCYVRLTTGYFPAERYRRFD